MGNMLFRGKIIDETCLKGKWMEGNPLYDGIAGKYYIHMHGNSLNESDRVGEEGLLRFIAYEIDPEIICQYTGLKDKNGKKIYEWDIVKVEHEKYEKESENDFFMLPETVHYEGNYVIEFVCKGGHCGYRCRNKSIHFPIAPNTIYNHKIEVIGNIFDNPELLEAME